MGGCDQADKFISNSKLLDRPSLIWWHTHLQGIIATLMSNSYQIWKLFHPTTSNNSSFGTYIIGALEELQPMYDVKNHINVTDILHINAYDLFHYHRYLPHFYQSEFGEVKQNAYTKGRCN